MPKLFTLDDGLNFEAEKFNAPVGSLSDCLNYERTNESGMSRIRGLSRFDGTAGVDSYRYWRLTTTSVTGSLTAGMAVYFTAGQVGYVLSTTTVGDTTVVYTVFPSNAANPTLPATLTGTGGTSATILTREVLDKPGGGTQATLDTALKAMADTRRSAIGTVTGRTGSDILHLFWLKNRLYAVRDLCRVAFSGGLYTDANEGQYVTISGSQYEILDVLITGDNSGVLTIDCTAGSGTAATPPGSPVLSSMSLSGTLTSPGYVNDAYSSSLTLSGGTSPITWSIVEEGATSVTPIDPIDTSSYRPDEQQTNAALWKATASGWVRQDLGREMAFDTGGANIRNFSRELTLDSATVKSTDYVFPTASTLNGSTTTGVNADDGTLTNLTGATGDSIIAKTFDFSGIPSTAIIKGIEVVVERRSDTANQAQDMVVDLVGLTGTTDNKAKSTAWPNTIGTATYGGQNDLWGNRGITIADVKASGFGVRVVAKRVVSGTATVGGVDYIKVKIYYVERETPAYVWDGSTDVEIQIRHIQILGGDTGANTAYGYVTLTAPQNADKSRLINVGDEIRTAASGAGNLIAKVAGRDRPIWLPGQQDIDGNSSRYRSYVGNFYYQDEYDAAYTVQGCGPCWYWDDTRCIRIRVPLGDTPDAPRDVARHGERLMLSYPVGTLIGSVAGNPFEMRGSEGAQVFPIGDRITGITALGGDAMLIQCERSMQTLRGYTAATFFRQPVKANRGGIEYCFADIGSVVGVDGQGIFVADAPEQMGPANQNYISQKVARWLAPRLQSVLNSDQAYLRPITALSVRSKSQFRLFFWDGYVLTMTMAAQPIFTLQRYYVDSGSDDQADTPWPIRAVCSGYDSTGRERLFVSFAGAKEGYVFEMDVGRSFDGAVIPAYIVTNPIPMGQTQQQLCHLSHLFVMGEGTTVATLTASRNVDYYDPDPTVSVSMTMGSSSNNATEMPKGFKGVAHLPAEGYDLTLRFDSSTATEGPHTLQAVSLQIDEGDISSGHLRAR